MFHQTSSWSRGRSWNPVSWDKIRREMKNSPRKSQEKVRQIQKNPLRMSRSNTWPYVTTYPQRILHEDILLHVVVVVNEEIRYTADTDKVWTQTARKRMPWKVYCDVVTELLPEANHRTFRTPDADGSMSGEWRFGFSLVATPGHRQDTTRGSNGCEVVRKALRRSGHEILTPAKIKTMTASRVCPWSWRKQDDVGTGETCIFVSFLEQIGWVFW